MQQKYMRNYIRLKKYNSPFGEINIILEGNKIKKVLLGKFKKNKKIKIRKDSIGKALYKYFKEKDEKFLRKIPLLWEGINTFEKKVLEYLRKNVKFSERITYGEIAKIFNISPRKVGKIMKKNPFPIFIPCHRVIGKKGIGGFSYGINWKIALLDFEK